MVANQPAKDTKNTKNKERDSCCHIFLFLRSIVCVFRSFSGMSGQRTSINLDGVNKAIQLLKKTKHTKKTRKKFFFRVFLCDSWAILS
jgi:hypothetical protein